MATPAIVGTVEGGLTAAGTNLAVTLPAGGSATDCYLVIIAKGSVACTINALADWAEIMDNSVAADLTAIWYTGSGVPANPTFVQSASSRSVWCAYRITGSTRSTTPTIGTIATGSSVNPNPPSATVTGGPKNVLAIACFAQGATERADNDTLVTTFPTNYTDGQVEKTGGTGGTNLAGLLGSAGRQVTGASSEDPGTFTSILNAAWRAQTIIVYPGPTYVTLTPATETDATVAFTGGIDEPATAILDSGTAADGALSANWTADITGQGYALPRYLSNQIAANAGNAFSSAYWNVGTFGADCEVYCTLPVLQANAFRLYLGVLDPVTATMDGYELEVDGTNAYIHRVDDQVRTLLGGAGLGAHGLVAGDKIRLTRIGSTLTASKTSGGVWSPLGSRTDSTYTTAGYIGLMFQNDSTARVTNFGGGTRAGGPIQVTLVAATETDAAQALTFTKTIFKSLTEATETDAAQALSVTKPIPKSITPATETDSAESVTFLRAVNLVSASETDAAQAITFTKTIFKTLTASTETDTAEVLSFVKPIIKTITATDETDAAVLLDFTFGGGGGTPIEVTLTPATETSEAQALTLYKTLSLIAATETDEAQTFSAAKTFTIVAATETDAAQVLALVKSVTLTPGEETDSAEAMSVTKTILKTLTPAGEVDAAIALSYTGGEAPVLRRAFGPIIIGRF